jgi:asparagine synthetase B (glutamine-hydrolysing)
MAMVKLAIVDQITGDNLYGMKTNLCVVCNGEIYNHKQLCEKAILKQQVQKQQVPIRIGYRRHRPSLRRIW